MQDLEDLGLLLSPNVKGIYDDWKQEADPQQRAKKRRLWDAQKRAYLAEQASHASDQ